MWIDLFLEKREVRKLVIYQEITTLKSVDLAHLKIRTKFTESTLVPLIQEIETDLSEMNDTPVFLIRHSKLLEIPDVHHYRQYLLEHSLVAQAFYTMLLTPEANIKEFCETQFLSRATVFRKLSVVKEILAPFHLQFNINQLELVGSELAIRYFFCNVCWFLKPQIIEEYRLEGEQLVVFIDSLCNTFDAVALVGNKQKFELSLKIGDIRRKAGYYIKELIPSSALILPPSFIESQHVRLSSFLKQSCPQKYLLNEELSFYFILYSGAIYVHSETDVYNMFKQWSAKRYEPYQIIEELTTRVVAVFLFENFPKNYAVILANMTSVFNAYVVMKDAPPFIFLLLQKNWQIHTPLAKQLHQYCFKFLKRISRRKNYLFLENHLDSLAHVFTYFLWPFIQDVLRQQKLSIAIIAEDNFITMLSLYNFFSQHPYVELCPYDETRDVDLLVVPHHSFYPEDDSKQVFHYNYLAMDNQFSELQKVLEKRQLFKYETHLSSQLSD